jgi:hypothetical protein
MQANPLPLKDIHTPEMISWWPPALGWWLLAILVPLSILLGVRIYKQLTRKTAVKTAKKFLKALKLDTAADNGKKLNELSMLVRRVAISTSPRTEVASLTGRAWLTFLDNSVKGASFTEGVGRHLAEAQYRQSPPDDLDISELINLCENWLNAQSKQK